MILVNESSGSVFWVGIWNRQGHKNHFEGIVHLHKFVFIPECWSELWSKSHSSACFRLFYLNKNIFFFPWFDCQCITGQPRVSTDQKCSGRTTLSDSQAGKPGMNFPVLEWPTLCVSVLPRCWRDRTVVAGRSQETARHFRTGTASRRQERRRETLQRTWRSCFLILKPKPDLKWIWAWRLKWCCAENDDMIPEWVFLHKVDSQDKLKTPLLVLVWQAILCKVWSGRPLSKLLSLGQSQEPCNWCICPCIWLQEIILALKQWETKCNFMWETAVKVVPVNLRTQGITEPMPIRAIADYETSTVSKNIKHETNTVSKTSRRESRVWWRRSSQKFRPWTQKLKISTHDFCLFCVCLKNARKWISWAVGLETWTHIWIHLATISSLDPVRSQRGNNYYSAFSAACPNFWKTKEVYNLTNNLMCWSFNIFSHFRSASEKEKICSCWTTRRPTCGRSVLFHPFHNWQCSFASPALSKSALFSPIKNSGTRSNCTKCIAGTETSTCYFLHKRQVEINPYRSNIFLSFTRDFWGEQKDCSRAQCRQIYLPCQQTLLSLICLVWFFVRWINPLRRQKHPRSGLPQSLCKSQNVQWLNCAQTWEIPFS